MAFPISKVFALAFAFFLAAAHAANLSSVITSLENAPVLRCGTGCDKSFIKKTFNYLLFTCRNQVCDTDFTIRTNPFGSSNYIQEYCVVSEPFHSSAYSMRIQVDLIPQGARLVLVAVPRSTRTETEKFKRPYVLAQTIPRNQLYIVQQMVNTFCKGSR